ncbi:MAG TPA: cellulase family glycosylhydrolase [Rhodanobacteraceae bacterium]|nr:cellulase family glycosylhydrolase [Rhodanobacteraceae bacterium]
MLLWSGASVAAEHVFRDGFEPPRLRGVNIAGMEMAYFNYPQATGPVAGGNYAVLDTGLIDYYAGKQVRVLRLLFSWEAMQPQLGDPIPAAAGNYRAYFDNYKRIVDYATDVQGMQVVIEPWQADAGGGAGGARWRGMPVGSAQVPVSAFAGFWAAMAAQFRDNGLVSYGLVNEPNNMSTMQWFAAAQAAIDAIRAAGSSQRILVPGNGYSAASTWTSSSYDTGSPQRSNAYGWLNANGPGQPLHDPAGRIAAEVHTYLDSWECACSDTPDAISSTHAASDHLAVVVDEARAHGYRVWLGEIGFYAGNAIAAATWADFVAYADANRDTLEGYAWWAGGMPAWWPDVHAPHFSVAPTDAASLDGDSINMDLIEPDF